MIKMHCSATRFIIRTAQKKTSMSKEVTWTTNNWRFILGSIENKYKNKQNIKKRTGSHDHTCSCTCKVGRDKNLTSLLESITDDMLTQVSPSFLSKEHLKSLSSASQTTWAWCWFFITKLCSPSSDNEDPNALILFVLCSTCALSICHLGIFPSASEYFRTAPQWFLVQHLFIYIYFINHIAPLSKLFRGGKSYPDSRSFLHFQLMEHGMLCREISQRARALHIASYLIWVLYIFEPPHQC